MNLQRFLSVFDRVLTVPFASAVGTSFAFALANCVAANAIAQQSNVVYKYVDQTGRTIYSNTPIKGGKVLELEPLTIVPGLPQPEKPTAAIAALQAPAAVLIPVSPVVPPQITPKPQPAPLLTQPAETPASAPVSSLSTASSVAADPAPTATPRIKVLPLPSNLLATSPATAALPAPVVTVAPPTSLSPSVAIVSTTPNAAVSSTAKSSAIYTTTNTSLGANAGINAAAMAQQRREDVRRRILEGEIEAEEQLMNEVREQLATEQAKSQEIRALSVSLARQIPANTKSKDMLDAKATVARHFEQIRELQDQIVMHQQNIADLKSQFKTAPLRSVGSANQKTAQLKPVTVKTP